MKAKELTLCGLFIALITVGTFIRIPIPGGDYFTLQFLFTLLAGIVLGGRLGALAVGTYVLLGLVGVPVFAAGGGPGYIVQPTFGYLLGFILQAWFCGHYAHQLKDVTFRHLLLVNVGGWLSSTASDSYGSIFSRTMWPTRRSASGVSFFTAGFSSACRTSCSYSAQRSSAFACSTAISG